MSSSGEPCSRLGKLVGGCKFEPRYDLGPADLSAFTSIAGNGSGQFIERMRKKTYVHDICIRCGKVITVNRPVP